MIQSLKYSVVCVVLVTLPTRAAQNLDESYGYGIEEYPTTLHEHPYIAMSDTASAAQSLKDKLAADKAKAAVSTTPQTAQKPAATLKQPPAQPAIKSAATLKQEKAAAIEPAKTTDDASKKAATVTQAPETSKTATTVTTPPAIAPLVIPTPPAPTPATPSATTTSEQPSTPPTPAHEETAPALPLPTPEPTGTANVPQFGYELPASQKPQTPLPTPMPAPETPKPEEQKTAQEQAAKQAEEKKQAEPTPEQISEMKAPAATEPVAPHGMPELPSMAQPEMPTPTAHEPTVPEQKPIPTPIIMPTVPVEPMVPAWTMPTTEPEAPQKPAEPVEPEEQLTIDELTGIDTSELEEPQGNWLYKRIWWERAEAKYEKLRAAVSQVFEARMKFFNKRSEVDRNIIDPFFLKVGVNQGELASLVEQMIAKIEQERTAHATDEEKNKELLAKLEQDKTDLEETLKSVQTVIQLDGDIDQALVKLMEQINRMRSYEQQAWGKFKEIARTLDDKKARTYYYEIDGAWKNVKEIQNYIIGNYNRSFNDLVTQLQAQIKNIDDSLQGLQERGIDLKKQSDQLARAQHEQAMKALEAKQQEELSDQEEQQEESEGFFSSYIISPVKALFGLLYDGVTWPFRWLFGSSEGEQDEEVEEGQEQEAQEPTPAAALEPQPDQTEAGTKPDIQNVE